MDKQDQELTCEGCGQVESGCKCPDVTIKLWEGGELKLPRANLHSQPSPELLLTDEELEEAFINSKPYKGGIPELHYNIAKAQLAKCQQYFQPCSPDCITFQKRQSEKITSLELLIDGIRADAKAQAYREIRDYASRHGIGAGTALENDAYCKVIEFIDEKLANLKQGKSLEGAE